MTDNVLLFAAAMFVLCTIVAIAIFNQEPSFCTKPEATKFRMIRSETRKHAGGMWSCYHKGGTAIHEIKPWGELVTGCDLPKEKINEFK